MSQSDFIFSALVFAFFVLLVQRGDLPKLIDVFVGPGDAVGSKAKAP